MSNQNRAFRICATVTSFTVVSLASLGFSSSMPIPATAASRMQTAAKEVPNYKAECGKSPADCMQKIGRLTENLKTYVGRLKPGDPVYLNPQPEPPGKGPGGDSGSLNPQLEPPGRPGPDPGPGDPLMSYRVLQARLAGLRSADPNLAAGGVNAQKWSAQLKTVQQALDRLGMSQTQKTAAAALASFSQSLNELTRMASPGQ